MVPVRPIKHNKGRRIPSIEKLIISIALKLRSIVVFANFVLVFKVLKIPFIWSIVRFNVSERNEIFRKVISELKSTDALVVLLFDPLS